MVYLTARSTTNLYRSPSSLDLGSAKTTILPTTLGLGTKFNPTVRFSRLSSLRLHTSSLTLSHHVMDLPVAASLGKDEDPRTLLLTPYSRSCYLLAQANRSKSLLILNSNGSSESNSSSSASSLIHATSRFAKTDQRSELQILRAKQRASILWLLAKSNDNGRIPPELRDPFYRDHNGQELLKPWITQRLANAELYGRALANIYGVPDYSCLSHQNILQVLTRRGAFSEIMSNEIGEPITETLLLKNSPIKLNAHMVIIECILTLYIREILIPVKVAEVVARFSGECENFDDRYAADIAFSEPEDVALFWVNRACGQLNVEISREYYEAREQGLANESCPEVPSLEELSDMCDGCSLFGLLAFYCPNHVDWRDICLKQDISIADSIYNLQKIQDFCADNFPTDVCFLSLEDFLYLPEPIVPNFLAFIADLLYLFEIAPVDSVTPPCTRRFSDSICTDEFQPNYPQLPTPSEMKARSLKHQSWNDSLEMTESSYSPSHQLYDRKSYKTLNNNTLNSSSRRNSLTNQHGSRMLHRRSSLLSNSSENQPNAMLINTEEEGFFNGVHGNFEPEQDHTQLSSYFSSLSIASNCRNSTAHDSEYYKNRNRASGSHLNDYFSSLSNPNDSRNSTHVQAKINHPNNTDNVKSLLSHQEMPSNHFDSQTTSSDTSSIAELSEYSDIVRAQLSEKRKQIELERQNERQKRVSSDQNFRQEVFKTLKGIQPDSGGSDAEPQEAHKMYSTNHKNEDENLTFEIHELNPIRREKTFTSIPSKNSNFGKKNLFTASDDLKASMTDLNYSNSKDNSYKSLKTLELEPSEASTVKNSSEIKNDSMSVLELSKPEVESEKVNSTGSIAPLVENTTEPVQQVVPPGPPAIAQTATTPRRSWGQPMIPLAGHYGHPSPPTWSQTPGSYVTPEWYQGQAASPYHQQIPPSQPSYPSPFSQHAYAMGTLPHPPPPPVIRPPYALHVDPHQYQQYVQSQDPYMSLGYIQQNGAPGAIFSTEYSSPATTTTTNQPNPTLNTHTNQTVNLENNIDLNENQSINSPQLDKQNESFFISFNDERSVNNRPKQTSKSSQSVPEKQGLTRTATQIISNSSAQLDETDDRIKQLYDVKRPSVSVPAVSFVVAASEEKNENTMNGTFEDDSKEQIQSRPTSEEEMTRKKELIMKSSLRRRAQQEEKRQQKEQELAVKRESERFKREQMERKKEEERTKRAFILEQYKHRKQMEEDLEKNGGCLPVTRSTSTLVLNRTAQQSTLGSVTMRPQRLLSGGRPRPKSIHSTIAGFDGTATLSTGRLSSSRDEIDLVGRASRPQSALGSQLSSTVTTPTGYSDHSFAVDIAMNNTGPTSSNFYNTEYNGPKLFVKPSQKSNKTLILNAINVVLAGAVNADTNRRVAEVINSCDSKYYLILFRNSGLQYRAIYSYNPEREEVAKLDGIGPRSVNNEMIDKFYKYNSGTKSFTPIQTKHLCVTIDAFTIHNHLWMNKNKQQQMTPRRFT